MRAASAVTSGIPLISLPHRATSCGRRIPARAKCAALAKLQTATILIRSVCEYVVKMEFSKRVLSCCVLIAAASLTACGTPPAKDFGGSWKPVNHFQDAPSEIPLNPTYTYYAAPMDETLRTMLRRWTKDAGLQFSYQLQSDYTLYKAVTQIHTTDVYSATTELSSIYAAQGVSVTTDGHEIRVSAARMSESPGTTEAPAGATPPSPAAQPNTPPAQAK